MGSTDMNSGPSSWAPSTLAMDPSPQSEVLITTMPNVEQTIQIAIHLLRFIEVTVGDN